MYYVKTCVYVIIVAMVLSLTLTYASMMTIIQSSKDNTERVLTSYITQNSIEIYQSIKNGTDYIMALDEDQFILLYDQENPLVLSDDHLYSLSDQGDCIFRITIPTVRFTVDHTLNLTCEYQIKIPVEFAGKQVSELMVPITVTETYNFKS